MPVALRLPDHPKNNDGDNSNNLARVRCYLDKIEKTRAKDWQILHAQHLAHADSFLVNHVDYADEASLCRVIEHAKNLADEPTPPGFPFASLEKAALLLRRHIRKLNSLAAAATATVSPENEALLLHLARCCFSLACTLDRCGDYAGARPRHLRFVRLLAALRRSTLASAPGLTADLTAALCTLGRHSAEDGRPVEALGFFYRAKALADETEDASSQATVAWHLGQWFLQNDCCLCGTAYCTEVVARQAVKLWPNCAASPNSDDEVVFSNALGELLLLLVRQGDWDLGFFLIALAQILTRRAEIRIRACALLEEALCLSCRPTVDDVPGKSDAANEAADEAATAELEGALRTLDFQVAATRLPALSGNEDGEDFEDAADPEPLEEDGGLVNGSPVDVLQREAVARKKRSNRPAIEVLLERTPGVIAGVLRLEYPFNLLPADLIEAARKHLLSSVLAGALATPPSKPMFIPRDVPGRLAIVNAVEALFEEMSSDMESQAGTRADMLLLVSRVYDKFLEDAGDAAATPAKLHGKKLRLLYPFALRLTHPSFYEKRMELLAQCGLASESLVALRMQSQLPVRRAKVHKERRVGLACYTAMLTAIQQRLSRQPTADDTLEWTWWLQSIRGSIVLHCAAASCGQPSKDDQDCLRQELCRAMQLCNSYRTLTGRPAELEDTLRLQMITR